MSAEGHDPHNNYLLFILFRETPSLTPSNETDIQRCVASLLESSSDSSAQLHLLKNIPESQPIIAAFSFINSIGDFSITPTKIVEELEKNGINAECSIFKPLDVQGEHPLLCPTMQVFIGVALTPNSSSEASFNDWYTEEHIPLLRRVPGWLSSARYILEAASSSSTPRYFAIHAWENAASFETQEYKMATGTPWREEVMNNVGQRERFDLKNY